MNFKLVLLLLHMVYVAFREGIVHTTDTERVPPAHIVCDQSSGGEAQDGTGVCTW